MLWPDPRWSCNDGLKLAFWPVIEMYSCTLGIGTLHNYESDVCKWIQVIEIPLGRHAYSTYRYRTWKSVTPLNVFTVMETTIPQQLVVDTRYIAVIKHQKKPLESRLAEIQYIRALKRDPGYEAKLLRQWSSLELICEILSVQKTDSTRCEIA
jgi:hypothetical protein